MESVIRNVAELEADERRVYETVLGHELRDDQQVVVRVPTPGVEPDPETKRRALERIRALSEKAAAHRESLGVSEAEADEVVDEAMEHVRPANVTATRRSAGTIA